MQDKSVDMIQNEENREGKIFKKFEQKLKDQLNDIKWSNICVTGILKGEERENGQKKKTFEEIKAKNVPKFD